MFKFLNAESKTIVGAATIVGVLSFASRFLGLIRDRVLAGEFGAGDTLDAYYAAFKVPDLLFALIVVGSLSAGFIPLFTSYWGNPHTHERAWRLTSHVLAVVVAGMGVVALVAAALATPIAALVAPGFPPEKQALVAELMRVMLLAQAILSFSIVFGSALQGMKRFVLYASAPVLYNLGIIVGAVAFVREMGPIGLAWGVVLGAGLHALVQGIGVWNAGWRPAFKRPILDRDVREVFRLTAPRMIGIAVAQLTFVALAVIASTLGEGSVTVFQFAYNIQFFPVGIVGVSFAIAAFPSLADHAAKKENDRFVEAFATSVRQMLFFIVPLTVLFLIVRAQVVRVVVGAGAFDWPSTIVTADTLAFFALSFVPQSLVYLLSRAFFALHDTVTPLAVGVVSGVLGVVTALWLTGPFGVAGLAIAFSLASAANAALLWVTLRGRVGALGEAGMFPSLVKIAIAAMVAAAVMQATKPLVLSLFSIDTFFGVFGQGFIAGGLGLASYVAICWFLRTQELHDLMEGMRRKVLRKAVPEEAIPPADGGAA
ncbi:murein biosynthesis integral membrane protein MurJ [Candidatus Uhrbacteria bacterium RIFCSPHIGHO2_01_FULL_63_20]|uniref:Probable lipid II flippase MurJ n=1 Tax=Candidatus Uhrbacteria bacterium RIFCSPHIGHO2_01_FULL_63_20 TaxID=1802385 RepID=A0A1F7TKL8_9BACT|nr:MAG: murein biosynthesis integral membrane protein MurJ [Candidatus Uhrbacteria bacterium RIFCSPHIGHO2_01_FULL_63_20]